MNIFFNNGRQIWPIKNAQGCKNCSRSFYNLDISIVPSKQKKTSYFSDYKVQSSYSSLANRPGQRSNLLNIYAWVYIIFNAMKQVFHRYIPFYSIWHILLSDILHLEQTNYETLLYHNIHPIRVCCIDSMSLSQPFKPWLALVLSTKYWNTDNMMPGKSWQTHCCTLFWPLFTFITQTLSLVFFFIYKHCGSICDLRFGGRILFNDCW